MTHADDPSNPYFTYLGLATGSEGTIVLPGDRRHAGDIDGTFLHGGVVAAFLEATAVLHLRSIGAELRIVDFTVSFLRPSAVTDTVAQAHLITRGRRFSVISVYAWQSDPAKPVALGQGTCSRGRSGYAQYP